MANRLNEKELEALRREVKISNYNYKVAERIKAELKAGQQRTVQFEEFAGTQKNFIEAAEEAGLTVVYVGAYVVTVKK